MESQELFEVLICSPYPLPTFLRGVFRTLLELFLKLVSGFQLLTIFAKSSILDVWQGSEYASGLMGLWYGK